MSWTDRIKPKHNTDPPALKALERIAWEYEDAEEHPYGYTNAGPLSKPLSLEELEKMEIQIEEIEKIHLPSPDILIMTEEHWKLLREQTPEAVSILHTVNRSVNQLLGIPVEVYPTYEECRARAFLLLDEGKRVGLVEDQPNEQS